MSKQNLILTQLYYWQIILTDWQSANQNFFAVQPIKMMEAEGERGRFETYVLFPELDLKSLPTGATGTERITRVFPYYVTEGVFVPLTNDSKY